MPGKRSQKRGRYSAVASAKEADALPLDATALPTVDGRTRHARRFHEIRNAILSDLGGADRVSEVRLHLANRFAALCVWAELQDARQIGGAKVDMEKYARIAGNLRRIGDALGFERVPREIETLDSYLRTKGKSE